MSDLNKGWKNYNNVMNEGGEGFNPFDRDISEANSLFIKRFRPDIQAMQDKEAEYRRQERERKDCERQEKLDRNGGWWPD